MFNQASLDVYRTDLEQWTETTIKTLFNKYKKLLQKERLMTTYNSYVSTEEVPSDLKFKYNPFINFPNSIGEDARTALINFEQDEIWKAKKNIVQKRYELFLEDYERAKAEYNINISAESLLADLTSKISNDHIPKEIKTVYVNKVIHDMNVKQQQQNDNNATKTNASTSAAMDIAQNQSSATSLEETLKNMNLNLTNITQTLQRMHSTDYQQRPTGRMINSQRPGTRYTNMRNEQTRGRSPSTRRSRSASTNPPQVNYQSRGHRQSRSPHQPRNHSRSPQSQSHSRRLGQRAGGDTGRGRSQGRGRGQRNQHRARS